jgi:hypothetical protein
VDDPAKAPIVVAPVDLKFQSSPDVAAILHAL